MQSRLKKVMILAALAVALPVVAFGQAARVEGLNVQGDYIKDYTNIFSYPSCVPNVGNLVYGDFGQSDYFAPEPGPNGAQYAGNYTYDRSVGAVLGNLWDGKFGTLSFHVRDYSPDMGTPNAYGLPTAYLRGDPNSGGEHESFDLMWGKKFGTMSLGLRMNRTYQKYTPDSLTNNTSSVDLLGEGSSDRNVMGFGGGLGFELNPNTKAEVGFLYQSRTFETKNSSYYNRFYDAATPTNGYIYGTLNEDGGAAYLLSARAMWQWQPNVMVIPVFKMYSFDLSTNFNPNDNTVVPAANTYDWRRDTLSTRTQKGWQVGLAGNWTLNQNDLFVAGLTFASDVDEQENDYIGQRYLDTNGRIFTYHSKTTSGSMPSLFAALETHVNPWLTLRFGGDKMMFGNSKTVSIYTYEDVTAGLPQKREVSTKSAYSDFSMNLGAGVKLGTLQFDGTLARDFFHNPTVYMFGNNSYPLFGRVTATYSF